MHPRARCYQGWRDQSSRRPGGRWATSDTQWVVQTASCDVPSDIGDLATGCGRRYHVPARGGRAAGGAAGRRETDRGAAHPGHCSVPRRLCLSARSHCRFVLPLIHFNTRFTDLFGASISETTMRPNPTVPHQGELDWKASLRKFDPARPQELCCTFLYRA